LPAFALTPLAWTAIRIGAMAAVAFYASRRTSEPKDATREQVLDGLPEGISGHAHHAEGERALHGAARIRRVLRVGRRGAAVEFEAAGLGRLRFRRVG
jgi:hypothetical protein